MAVILGRTGKSGNTQVGESASMPITQVGVVSSANTTFTATTVVDGTAWTLSAPAVGDFAKTSDGWIGRITAVSDVTDTLTVEEWINLANGARSKSSLAKPANGSAVLCHQLFRCECIKLKGDHANGSAGVHIQRPNAATTAAYELLANESLILFPEHGSTYVDATLVNAISSSGTIGLWFMGEAN